MSTQFIETGPDASDQVFVAVQQRLDRAVTWEGRQVRCWDTVPPGDARYPYYRLHPISVRRVGGAAGVGYGGAQSVMLQLDSYTDYQGSQQATALRREAVALLAGQPLVLGSGAAVVLARVEQSRTRPEEKNTLVRDATDLYFRIQLAAA